MKNGRKRLIQSPENSICYGQWVHNAEYAFHYYANKIAIFGQFSKQLQQKVHFLHIALHYLHGDNGWGMVCSEGDFQGRLDDLPSIHGRCIKRQTGRGCRKYFDL